jgi:hypothetical protein
MRSKTAGVANIFCASSCSSWPSWLKNLNKRLKTGLFFEKFQKIGLFLGCFYAFFRVFDAKNTVQQGAIIKVFLPYFQSAILPAGVSAKAGRNLQSAIYYPLPEK